MQFVFPKLHPNGLYAYVTIHVSINNFKLLHTLRALDDLISTGMVLVGVGLFVVEELAEAVVTSSEETTKAGTNPVDVVSMVETGSGNARTE